MIFVFNLSKTANIGKYEKQVRCFIGSNIDGILHCAGKKLVAVWWRPWDQTCESILDEPMRFNEMGPWLSEVDVDGVAGCR